MIFLTKPQRLALKKVFLRKYPSAADLRSSDALDLYRRFRKTVAPGPGCIMVKFAGMWLGIEPDGYTHS